MGIAMTEAPVPPPKDVQSEIFEAKGCGMVMRHAFTTPASPEKVWAAIASSEGLAVWAAAAANVDLRLGGAYELYFKPQNAPGKRGMEGNTILSFVPARMISYSGELPGTWVVYTIEKTDRGSHVIFNAMGTNP